MKIRLSLVATISALSVLSAFAQTNSFEGLKVKYQEVQTQITDECQKQKADALLSYSKSLDELMATLKKQGDLDTFILVEKEKKRFELEKTLPTAQEQHKYLVKLISLCDVALKKVDADSLARTTTLKKQYTVKLEALIRQLMVVDKIEEAKEIKAEIERIQSCNVAPLSAAMLPVQQVVAAVTNETATTRTDVPVVQKEKVAENPVEAVESKSKEEDKDLYPKEYVGNWAQCDKDGNLIPRPTWMIHKGGRCDAHPWMNGSWKKVGKVIKIKFASASESHEFTLVFQDDHIIATDKKGKKQIWKINPNPPYR